MSVSIGPPPVRPSPRKSPLPRRSSDSSSATKSSRSLASPSVSTPRAPKETDRRRPSSRRSNFFARPAGQAQGPRLGHGDGRGIVLDQGGPVLPEFYSQAALMETP